MSVDHIFSSDDLELALPQRFGSRERVLGALTSRFLPWAEPTLPEVGDTVVVVGPRNENWWLRVEFRDGPSMIVSYRWAA